MAKVMVTLQASGNAPTLESVKAHYGLTDAEIDADFGVVEIDPDDATYTVLVEEAAANKISGGDWKASGPYSNPPIAPFGPPEP